MCNSNLTAQIKLQMFNLEFTPVDALYPKGKKLFMERINETTKFLSNAKKVIIDASFVNIYNFNNKIWDGCFVVNDFIYKIDSWASINFPEKFIDILNKKHPPIKGTCFYLDDKLYLSNAPFLKCDSIRDNLLQQRNDGTMWFECLKIVDNASNATCFYPSKKAIKVHNELINKSL